MFPGLHPDFQVARSLSSGAIDIPGALELAINALRAGQLGVVEAVCERVIAADAAQSMAHSLLGITAFQQGRFPLALGFYDQAIALFSGNAEYFCNKGLCLHAMARYEEAIATYGQGLEIAPASAVILSNLGLSLLECGQPEAALQPLREAISQRPDYVNARYIHGNALSKVGRLGESAEAYRGALHYDPSHISSLHNLASTVKDQGDLDEALLLYRRCVDLCPDSANMLSNLLVTLHYHAGTTLAELFRLHCEYDRLHAAPLLDRTAQISGHRSRPDGPLRLGFISPHFARHPVGRFLIRLLEHLDPAQFHIHCYSDTRHPDAMTDRVRARARVWRETAGLSDEQLTTTVRGDGIDILFDLAGHTAGHRLLVFARRAAPVQISWLDYVGTTGLSTMDYLVADPHEIPAEHERWYREKVLRLARDYICFDPPDDAPPVNPLPARANGFITFGSFNIVSKTTPEIVSVWSRILRQMPEARLILMNRGFGDGPTAARFQRLFAEEKVAPERVAFHGWCSAAEVLARYHQLDIGLDTYPYNGGLSTCEALWMGVPVITCPGGTFCSRHGLTHLSAAGWEVGVAQNLDDYVERAVALATDLPRLAALRQSLRSKVGKSPLCDGQRFSEEFTSLILSVWQMSQQSAEP